MVSLNNILSLFSLLVLLPICVAFSVPPLQLSHQRLNPTYFCPSQFVAVSNKGQLSQWSRKNSLLFANSKSNIVFNSTSLEVAASDTEITNTQRQLQQQKWMDRYNQLKEFYNTNGHTFVPNFWEQNKQLGIWVFEQRNWFRRKTSNKTGKLIKPNKIYQERIDLMNEIGFVWNPEPHESKNVEWMKKYKLLKELYDKNGHKYVKDESLRKWVQRQRNWYKSNTDENGQLIQHKTYITYQERIDLLDEIGFDRNPSRSNSVNNESWMAKFHELQEFQEEFGHVNVPQIFEQNRLLGNWVHNQRQSYKNICGKHDNSEPHQERINLLNGIGFVWKVRSRPSSNVKWMHKYELLKDFYDKNGHVDVTDKSLHSWSKTQRSWYRKKTNENGELIVHDSIHQERIDLLNEIGFDWNPNPTPLFDNESWMAKFCDLQKFKKEFGHANVPQRWERDKSLGPWLDSQRQAYKNVCNKHDNPEPHQERINMLNEIGIDWSPNSWNARQARWMEQYNKLKAFHKEYGHTRVSCVYDKKLRNWLRQQDDHFKTLTNENGELIKFNKFYQERMDLMQEIGFEW